MLNRNSIHLKKNAIGAFHRTGGVRNHVPGATVDDYSGARSRVHEKKIGIGIGVGVDFYGGGGSAAEIQERD